MCLCGSADCRGSFLYHTAHSAAGLPQQQVLYTLPSKSLQHDNGMSTDAHGMNECRRSFLHHTAHSAGGLLQQQVLFRQLNVFCNKPKLNLKGMRTCGSLLYHTVHSAGDLLQQVPYIRGKRAAE